MGVSGLQVNRHRIVDSGLDASFGEMRHQPVPCGGSAQRTTYWWYTWVVPGIREGKVSSGIPDRRRS